MKTAKSVLPYYIKLALSSAGVRVDFDNDAEIAAAIDDIEDSINAAVKPLQERIEQLEKRLAEAERPSAA